MKKLFLLAVLGLGWQGISHAQFNITGQISDDQHEALAGASIWLEATNKATISNPDGGFKISGIRKGDYVINVSFIGYGSYRQQILLDRDMALEISLQPEAFLTDEVIVTATRASEKTPVTFTNVSKEEIQKQNLGQDIPFLLNQTPSVVVTSDAGAGVGYTGIRIRGSDPTRINVTINGIPYNDPESQGTFWVNLPDFASSVDNIQIQRGVGTSTNGSGAFGGTINIQTTTYNPDPYGSIDNSFGSFNTRKHTVIAGTGLINNRFTFDARLSRISSDGYIDRATADLKSYFVSGGYHGKSTLLKVNVFSGKEVTYQSWYGTPESRINGNREEMLAFAGRNSLTESQTQNLLNSGRTYNFYEYENEVDNYQQDHYQLILAQDITSQLSLNAAIFYTHGEGFFEQFRNGDDFEDYGLDNVEIGGEVIESTDLIRRRWLDNDYYGISYSLDFNPSKKTNLILGGGFYTYEGDHFGEIVWSQFASNSAIKHRYYDNTGEKDDLNVFFKVHHQLTNRLNVYGDMQFRRVTYAVEGIDNDLRNLLVDTDFNFFNPKVGFTYDINKSITSYASFSIGNREPTRNDFIDAPEGRVPKNETLRNIEAGVKKSGTNYSLQANYFLMDYKNQLVLTGELNDVGTGIRTNVAKSYRTGIELLAGFVPSNKWELMANLTFSRNKIRDFNEIIYDYGPGFDEFNPINNSYEDVDISFSPNMVGGSTISYKPTQNLSLSLLSKYVGSQFLDNTGNKNRQIDAYFINDFRLIYQARPKFLKSLTFSLLVNNIFDVAYEANGYTFGYIGGGQNVRENFYYPQAGTNFLLGASLKF